MLFCGLLMKIGGPFYFVVGFRADPGIGFVWPGLCFIVNTNVFDTYHFDNFVFCHGDHRCGDGQQLADHGAGDVSVRH